MIAAYPPVKVPGQATAKPHDLPVGRWNGFASDIKSRSITGMENNGRLWVCCLGSSFLGDGNGTKT